MKGIKEGSDNESGSFNVMLKGGSNPDDDDVYFNRSTKEIQKPSTIRKK